MRPLAKMMAGNGLIVSDILVLNAKQHDNMIEPLNQALQTSHPLVFDMFAYTIVRVLSDSREQPLDNESNVA